MKTLYGISLSAWTKRARWALDHHGVAYAYSEHLPLLGEMGLRRKTKSKHATVPLFEDGVAMIMGSLEIARHAEKIGNGTQLFPPDGNAEVERWAGLAEQMTSAGRAAFLERILVSPEGLKELVPSWAPGFMRGLLAPSVGMTIRFLGKKHGAPEDAEGEVRRTVVPILDELRTKVANAPTLVGSNFTYADIAMATSLHVVRPHADAKFGPHTRAAWANEELAAKYPDVLEWRDAVYGKYR